MSAEQWAGLASKNPPLPTLRADTAVGRAFDQTLFHSIPPAETDRFTAHYFPSGELGGKVVLDAGCRLGDYSAAFRRAGACRVVGVDLGPRCVAVAREIHGGNGTEFRCANVLDLRELDESQFDVAVCSTTLSYVSPGELPQAMAQLRRVLKPGGVLLALVVRDPGWWMRRLTSAAARLPSHSYAPLARLTKRLAQGPAAAFLGRQADGERLHYLLLGLRGLHYHSSVGLPPASLISTVETMDCSARTLRSYKARLAPDKSSFSST